MEYSNPKIPEGINTSQQHPLKDFFILTAGVLSILLIAIFLLGLLANHLAVYIPFETELAIVNKINKKVSTSTEPDSTSPMGVYLNDLANKISKAQGLPDSMKITVHYMDDDMVNAFATLGGHVFMFQGLMEKLPTENAIAMVLAHEIAHIKHRHPIRNMGRGLIIGMALTMVSSSLGNSIIDRTFDNTDILTGLKFSRDQEVEADKVALNSLLKIYGHALDAKVLFKALAQEESSTIQIPEFFSTHPLSKRRIKYVQDFQNKNPPSGGAKTTALPESL